MVDVTRALEHVDVGRRTDFYFALQSLMIHRPRTGCSLTKPSASSGARPLRVVHGRSQRPGEQRRFGTPKVSVPPGDSSGIDDPAVATLAESGITASTPRQRVSKCRAPRTSSSSPKRSSRAREMIAALSWDPGMRLTRRWAAGRGKGARPAPPDSPEHAARRRARVADARQDDDAPPAGPHLRRERIDGTAIPACCVHA